MDNRSGTPRWADSGHVGTAPRRLSAAGTEKLAAKLNGDVRARGDMGSRGRVLLASHAAADGLQLETGILRAFDCTTKRFAYEGWNFDAPLLHIEDHRATGGKRQLGRWVRSFSLSRRSG